MFTNNTSAVLTSSELLTASPTTLKLIFQLDKPTIHSEMELIWALERYINYHKNNDLEIRPALNCIRNSGL